MLFNNNFRIFKNSYQVINMSNGTNCIAMVRDAPILVLGIGVSTVLMYCLNQYLKCLSSTIISLKMFSFHLPIHNIFFVQQKYRIGTQYGQVLKFKNLYVIGLKKIISLLPQSWSHSRTLLYAVSWLLFSDVICAIPVFILCFTITVILCPAGLLCHQRKWKNT